MQFKNTPYLFEFTKIGDSSLGYISIAENESLPFAVKRVYWTYFTPNEVIRGHHAHKSLKQILVAVSGQITIDIENSNAEKTTFLLTKPNQGLFIPPFCWRTLQFSHNAVLMCLASENFTEGDYIRDYNDFKKLIENG